jgi:class 3 adenylate cyclase
VWSFFLIATVGVLALMALTLATWPWLSARIHPRGKGAPPLIFVPLNGNPNGALPSPEPPWWQAVFTARGRRLARDIRFLYHVTQLINRATSVKVMLNQVLEQVATHLSVDLGRIFLLNENDTLQLITSTSPILSQEALPNWEFTLPHLTLAADKPLIISDLTQWPQLRSFVSATHLASVLWLPLKTGGEAVGALGLGSHRSDAFDEEVIAVVSAVACHLATGVENLRLRQQMRREKELRQTLERYVSPRLVTSFQRQPPSEPQEIIDASDRITVLFADVRNYTPLMEQTNPNAVMQVLNEYFLRMSQIIQSHGGVVDEFVGDEIVASFDHASPRINDAYRAIRAGVEMLNSLETLRRRWEKRGLPSFDIGIGISTGAVTRGSIGSAERKALIALGPILNIASRAQSKNKEFGTHLIITQSTFEQVADLIEYKPLGVHQLQGISQPMPLYSVQRVRNNHRTEPKATYDPNELAQPAQRGQAFAE